MQHYREILLKKFTEEYQKLNTEQRKAVDTIEGPVMVIAGPGQAKHKFLLQELERYYWKQMYFPKIFYALLIPMPAQLPCEKGCCNLSAPMHTK